MPTTEAILYCVLQILNHGPQAKHCHAKQQAVTAAYAIQEAHYSYPTVPPALIAAVMAQESGFNVRAKGTHGEIGLMQVMRGGALEGHLSEIPDKQLYNPRVNVPLGARYLAMMQRRCGYKPQNWLSCYNGRRGHSVYSESVLARLKKGGKRG